MRRTLKNVLIKRPIAALVVTALLAVSVVFMGAGTLTASVPFHGESLTSNIPGMPYVRSVAWNGTYWLIGGEGGVNGVKLVRYDGGSAFTDLTPNIPGTSLVYSIAWNGSYWLIGGGLGPSTLIKYDGINFTDLTSALPMSMNVVNSIAWNGFYWLIGGYGQSHLIKYDGGSAYTDLTPSLLGMSTVTSIAWNNTGSYWLIGGGYYYDQTLLRYNGTNFTSLTPNVSGMLEVYSVAWNGSYWLIGGEGVGRLVKYNGSAFTDLTSNVSGMGYVRSIAWNGSYWLIGGSGTKTLIKYDGTDFTDLTSNIPGMGDVRSVAWGGDYWLIGGQSSETLYKLTEGYTLTPSAGPNGTISPAIPQVVDEGGSQAFNFTANSGYHVADVKVDTVSVGHPNSYTFTDVTDNHTIDVTFAINQYTLTPSAGAHGTISPATPQVIDYGGSQTFNFAANPGYHVADVLVDGASVGAVGNYTFNNVAGNHAITVSFAADPVPPPTPPPTDALATWYLAEGSTNWGFSTYIAIENPNNVAVTANVTYLTTDGPVNSGDVYLPSFSQATINPADKLGGSDFSTKVVCREGLPIAVDRTMEWVGAGASASEGHSSIGVNAPAKTWYLPEGSSQWGFETWLCIENPNNQDAVCKVTYMTEGAGGSVTFVKKVPANSRGTFNMTDDIGKQDSSIKVESDVPVLPERSVYRNNRREGSCSIGTTSPSEVFDLAEGSTAWGFTTYVLVQNPNDREVEVAVTYMTVDGPIEMVPFKMLANSRKTIRVNDILPNTDLSTRVHGSLPIIAERSMYWSDSTGEACHDSIGTSAPHSKWYLPDGETSRGRETFTMVQNPNNSPATIEVSYMTPTGAGNVVFEDTVPPNSRRTYNMIDKGITGRAGVRVVSKGGKIIVERSMYWNNRRAGTDTIGGFSD